jgi:hypothetical protein
MYPKSGLNIKCWEITCNKEAIFYLIEMPQPGEALPSILKS